MSHKWTKMNERGFLGWYWFCDSCRSTSRHINYKNIVTVICPEKPDDNELVRDPNSNETMTCEELQAARIMES